MQPIPFPSVFPCSHIGHGGKLRCLRDIFILAFSVTAAKGTPVSCHGPLGLSYSKDAWCSDTDISQMADTTPRHIPVATNPAIIVTAHMVVTTLSGLKALTCAKSTKRCLRAIS